MSGASVAVASSQLSARPGLALCGESTARDECGKIESNKRMRAAGMTTTAATVKATVNSEGRRKKNEDVEDTEYEASEARAGATQNVANENDRKRRPCLDMRK